MTVMLSMLCMAAVAMGAAVAREDDEVVRELLRKAVLAAEQGNFAAADRFYEKILEQAPDSEAAALATERLAPNALLLVRTIADHGPPERRIDVFVMAEGYLRKDQKAFLTQAENTARLFFQVPVFRRYQQFFSFHAMHIASAEDKVDRGDDDYDTALGAYETSFSQGQVAVRGNAVREYLARDPRSEGLAVVIVRRGTLGTGGGGVAVVGGGASNTVIHEWGHAFGMLLDEYTSDVGYGGDAPRAFNISDTEDPAAVPWKHWLEARTRGVGVIPGGAGRATGVWRSSGKPCAMASGSSYCLVCREALVASIYGLVSPLDEASPAEPRIQLAAGQTQDFVVVPMEVESAPFLEVEFALNAGRSGSVTGAGTAGRAGATRLSPDGRGAPGRGRGGGRRRGGAGAGERPRWGMPAFELTGEPQKAKKIKLDDGRTAYQVTLSADALGPGDHVLRARVQDPTDWVLREDWRHCLTDGVVWDVHVDSSSTPVRVSR